VPQYVLCFIYSSPALCFILVYNCGLTVRNKRMLCYVMVAVRYIGWRGRWWLPAGDRCAGGGQMSKILRAHRTVVSRGWRTDCVAVLASNDTTLRAQWCLHKNLSNNNAIKTPSAAMSLQRIIATQSRRRRTEARGLQQQLVRSQLGKADRHSLDFTFRRLCMKLFLNGSIDIVKDCQCCFDLPSFVLIRWQDKFILRYSSTVNGFCQFCNKL